MSKDNKQDIIKEVFKEIEVALGKLKITTLKDIIKTYKAGKEEDLRDQLLTFNINFNSNENEDIEEDDLSGKGKKKKKEKEFFPWIEIGDQNFPIYMLYSIGRDDSYDYRTTTDNAIVYSIIINKGVETKNTVIRDILIQFDTQEEREKEYSEIETKLYPYGIRFI